MSFFATSDVASGYAQSRPYFHPEVIQRIKAYIGIDHKYRCALDVGCGAGLSTLALREIAASVVGVDSSAAMVESAIREEGIEYFNYPAENLPFQRRFELVTLAGSVNWIDRPQFFSEAKRILNADSFVVVYDNNILGIMEEDDRFETWYRDSYLKKYPKPPRDESPITREEAVGYGFEFVHSEDYTNKVKFTLDGFIDYILTQSNITVALEKETEGADAIREWFASSSAPFFQSAERTLMFGGYIWYLKNSNT